MQTTAIIIPNWNGIAEIEAAISSLQKQTTPISIIVVDNGSRDGSLELIEETFPSVILLPQLINLGFAGGVNVGIRYALDHNFLYIGLFNSDAVAATDWVANLLEVLTSDKTVGIATGLLLHGDGKTIDSTGDWYSLWGLPFPRGRGEATLTADQGGPVFSASGGASLYRAELFKTIGLFDETFFAYYEDVDISFRAQLSGYIVRYNPSAVAYHERGSASVRMGVTKSTNVTKVSGFTVFQTFKNLPILFYKNVPGGLMPIICPRFILAYFLMLGNAIKNGNGLPALNGFIRSLSLLPHAFRERKKIQSSKKISDAYIKSILWPDLPPDQTGLRKFRKLFTGKS
jgi:GT2 family glycosyltransferase